jgi:hypothetical protein
MAAAHPRGDRQWEWMFRKCQGLIEEYIEAFPLEAR